ncbi:glutathione S-transferase family protein [Paragemmobacter straminiformis]|uniref:Glutathione S-transferase family protein n=1 Tax=Paragemmobacter straminiformis TaxID=2045119 RepID=A0A842I2S2_9RHOB|nr:glutathione S-transferase family protein [Gemmobacter straminiformis]MBC2834039.1 glutathione S-transferase family protein [Gemmobacter straminiformis]
MHLYADPLSTSCRPVLMMIADQSLAVEIIPVNLHLNETAEPDFLAINPNGTLPVLRDGDLVLTESSAILKHLALRFDLAVYPTDPRAQILVDEMVSWFSTNFWAYHCILGTYPRMLPALGWLNPITLNEISMLAAHGSARYLTVLDRRLAQGGPFVCGPDLTIADYTGIAKVTLADYVDFDFSPYPAVSRWCARMRERDGWTAAFAGFTGLVDAARQQRSATVA